LRLLKLRAYVAYRNAVTRRLAFLSGKEKFTRTISTGESETGRQRVALKSAEKAREKKLGEVVGAAMFGDRGDVCHGPRSRPRLAFERPSAIPTSADDAISL